MPFLHTSDLADAVSFRSRIMVGIVKVAGNVLGEAQNSMPVPQATKRIALANSAFRDPRSLVAAFVWPVLSNTSIANAGLDSPDADLEYQISEVWDQVAGVTNADKTTPSA